MTSRLRRPFATAAVLTLLTLGAVGCSSGSEQDSATAGDGGAVAEAASEDFGDDSGAAAPGDSTADMSTSQSALTTAEAARPQALIATGNVALRSRDVGRARFDVRKVVDAYDGAVAENSTETDADGEPDRARLVLRIPSASFDDAMSDLEEVAEVISSSTTVDDVTTQVIDTDVRVRLQRRSIERIELLLDRAESIRDIVSIESQLSRREADLGSLEQQQAFLADQTSLATITVSLERPAKDRDPGSGEDEKGFLSGLDQGWTGLKNVTVGLLTVGGAVLPFAIVALLLGVPLTWAGRSLRRRTSMPNAASVPADA